MIWAETPVAPDPPRSLTKEQREKREEHAGDFVPQRTNCMGKRLPESAAESTTASRNVLALLGKFRGLGASCLDGILGLGTQHFGGSACATP